ncbi:hypothetical protein [Streptomyces parvulus]
MADNRRTYARGDMDADRVEQLEKPGMVWSHFDGAWEEGLAAAGGRPSTDTSWPRWTPPYRATE